MLLVSAAVRTGRVNDQIMN